MVKMSRNWRTKTKVIHDPNTMSPGESITILTFYGDAARQKILSAAIEQRTDEDGRTVTVATLDRLHAVKRQIAVVGWTLLDDEGEPLPFDRDTLLNLPTEVASFVDRAIDDEWDNLGALVVTPEEAEKKAEEDKEDEATFHRHLAGSSNGAGEAANVGENDAPRVGHRAARRATSA